MKRIFSFVTTFFVCALMSANIHAQEPSTVSAGSVISDTGKALTFVSGGFVIASATSFVDSHLRTVTGNGDFGTGLNQIFSIILMAYGGIGMLAGGAMWLTGDLVMRLNGDASLSFGNENCRGFGMIMDLGYSTPVSISPRMALGYNFSKHVFVGAGAAGYVNMSADRRPYHSLPIFAMGRFTFGSRLVSPYVDVNVGADSFNSFKLFYSTGGGARFRLSERQDALSLGMSYESSPVDHVMSVRLSYIF